MKENESIDKSIFLFKGSVFLSVRVLAGQNFFNNDKKTIQAKAAWEHGVLEDRLDE